MINNELIAFIKNELVSNKTEDQIKNELLVKGGWSNDDIEQAFKSLSNQTYDLSSRKIEVGSNRKVLYVVLFFLILVAMVLSYFFRGELNSLLSSKEISNLGQEDVQDFSNIDNLKGNEIEQNNVTLEENESSTFTQDQQATVSSENSKKDAEPIDSSVVSLKPYQMIFLSPAESARVQLNESINIKIQVGEKIKKVNLNFNTYNIDSENNPKSVEIPVQSGYANYIFNVKDSTLVPITLSLEGIVDDRVAYIKAINQLNKKEASDMFRTIRLFTNKKPDAFLLENEDNEVSHVSLSQLKPSPQFLAGFPELGLIPISASDIKFNIADLNIVQINNTFPVLFKGLKEGSTKVTATYNGLSQDIYFVVVP